MTNLETVKKEDNTELKIGIGGLYSPLPIPAYKILINAGEHVAKDVLLCLVSHMGLGNRKVYPSITTISKESGRSRNSVVQGTKILEDFGFVKKYKHKLAENKMRNIYYLQDACWNNDRMNSNALSHSPVIGRCGCGARVRNGEIGQGMLGYHHYGCGDLVRLFSTKFTSKSN